MKKLVLFFLAGSLISCFQPQPNEVDNNETVSSLKNSSNIHLQISPVNKVYLKKIENWQEYRSVNELLKRYQQISPNEALNNALELKDLTQNLKDNINLKILNRASFQARANVLHNESLRLADMTYIPAITAQEINTQVHKILVVFSSLNEKINTIFIQKKFEDEIEISDFYIGLDTTKLFKKPLKKATKILPPPAPRDRY